MSANYSQRDVVNVEAKLPDGKLAVHPFVIISCRTANKEDFYTGVMMTSNQHTDMFTFPLFDEMFEGKLEKTNCQIRLYILASFTGYSGQG
jgi:hypothetical protein